MSRIQLEDTMQIALAKMAEGNIGAVSAMIKILNEGVNIDPDSAFGPYGVILGLDSCGIYGSNIYVLFSDICEKSVLKITTVMRAQQLGFISKEVLVDASIRQDYSGKSLINIDELLVKVQDYLPNFNKQTV